MNEILTELLKNTYSLNQLKRRLLALKNRFLKEFFNSEGSGELVEEAWLNSLPQELLKKFNKDNIYKIFEELEANLPKLTTLTLYLTFEPDEKPLSQIGEYARKTFNNKSLLLDIKYDPKLIAGAALSFKGVYRDYSVRSRIDERKVVILDSFKKFLR